MIKTSKPRLVVALITAAIMSPIIVAGFLFRIIVAYFAVGEDIAEIIRGDVDTALEEYDA